MSEVVVKFSLFVIILAMMLPIVGLAFNLSAYVVGKSDVSFSTACETYIKSFESNYMNTIIKMSRNDETGEISVETFFKNFGQFIYDRAEKVVKDII